MAESFAARISRRQAVIAASALCAPALTFGCSRPPSVQTAGGVVWVYDVVDVADAATLEHAEMPRLLKARIDPRRRLQGVVVRVVEGGRVEINIPKQADVDYERIKKRLTRAGKLEFFIAANQRDHDDLLQAARKSNAKTVKLDEQTTIARWIDLGTLQQVSENDAPLGHLILRDEKGNDVTMPQRQMHDPNRNVIAQLATKGVRRLEALVVIDVDGNNFSEEHIQEVREVKDSMGRSNIGFKPTTVGASMLKQVTTDNLPDADGFSRHLAIVVDNQMISAPKIHGAISGDGMISGNFDEEEVDDLITVLRIGRMPYELAPEPVSESFVGAK